MSKNLESKILFPITRVIVLIMMVIVIAVTAYQLIPKNIFSSSKNYTEISYDDVVSRLAFEKKENEEIPAEKEEVFVVPDNIKTHVDEENLIILKNWSEMVPGDKKNEYWSSLDEVIKRSAADDESDISASANAFRDILTENYDAYKKDALEQIGETTNPMMIMGLLLMFLLLGNLMAILAVERNTRRPN